MRLGTRLRLSPAVWLFVPLAIAAIAYSGMYPPVTRDPYPIAMAAAGGVTIAFLAPAAAALGAWEAGRLQRGALWTFPHARLRLWVAAGALWPIVAAMWLAVMAGVIVRVLSSSPHVPDARIAGAVGIVLTAHASLGFAIGLWVRPVVAAASILVVDYLWMAMPRSLEPLWLRHLTGDFSSCCEVTFDLAPVALLGAAAVAGGMLGAAMLLASREFSPLRAVFAAGFLAGSVAIGTTAVNALGPDPVVARDPAELVCGGGDPRVCLVPEHRERLSEVVAVAGSAIASWERVGIDVPRRFTESLRDAAQGDAAFMGISTGSTEADVRHAIAYALLPAIPACAEEGQSYPGAIARDYLLAWLSLTAGMSTDDVRDRVGFWGDPAIPDPTTVALEVIEAGDDTQSDWLAANSRAAVGCEHQPEPPLG